MSAGDLAEARAEFERGNLLGAFPLARRAVERDPRNPEALWLFAKLCEAGGERATALSLLRAAAELDPQNDSVRVALEGLQQSADPDEAQRCYAEARRRDPRIAIHTNAMSFVDPPVDGEVRRLLERAIEADLAFAPAHAAYANVLLRGGDLSGSLRSLVRAVTLDENDAAARLGLAQRLHLAGDDARATFHLERALEQQTTYSEPALRSSERRLLAVCAPGFWERSVPLDLVLDRDAWNVDKWYAQREDLPDRGYEIAVNAIAEPDAGALAAAAAYFSDAGLPVVNQPAAVARTERAYLCTRPLAHAVVPRTVRAARAELREAVASFDGEVVVRPGGSHKGEGLQRLSAAGEPDRYLETTPAQEFYVSAYAEYASNDGYYRKYRILFIGGRPFPYHLAISPHWMVHYFSAPMAQHAWMREEEAAFFRRFDALFDGSRRAALDEVNAALGLDYFGMDCALLPDGRVLVFEANANMLVHDAEPDDRFAYKDEPVARIFKAFAQLVERRANRRAKA